MSEVEHSQSENAAKPAPVMDYFCLRAKDPKQLGLVQSKPLYFGRHTVGAGDFCDVHINYPGILPIHLIIEIFPHCKKIYNLSGQENGIAMNQGPVMSLIQLGEVISLGEFDLIFDHFSQNLFAPTMIAHQAVESSEELIFNPTLDVDEPDRLPPIIEEKKLLPPIVENHSIKVSQAELAENLKKNLESEVTLPAPSLPERPIANSSSQRRKKAVKSKPAPYPYRKEYQFQQSEFLFEQLEHPLQRFSYEADHRSIEVVILFKDRVLSVDYIELNSSKNLSTKICYSLVGQKKLATDIEFSYFGPFERVPFIELDHGAASCLSLSDFQLTLFGNSQQKKDLAVIPVEKMDILHYRREDLVIYVRMTEVVPTITSLPIWKGDEKKWIPLLIAILFNSILWVGFSLFQVDRESVEEEQKTERITKILKIPKTEKAPEKSEVAVADAPAPSPEKKTVSETKVKQQPKKPAEKKQKQPQTVVVEKVVKAPSESKNVKKKKMDVYEKPAYESSLSQLLGKEVSLDKSAKSNKTKSNARGDQFPSTMNTGVTGKESSSIASAISDSNASAESFSSEQGIVGAKGFSAGAKGLIKSKSFYGAAIPSETVVVGLMDPDLILKILREHIPQFRYCYQREIDTGKDYTQGNMKLAFTIGSSGNVVKVKSLSAQGLPTQARDCVLDVLKGIQFPRLKADGVVEVVQPVNFYPRN